MVGCLKCTAPSYNSFEYINFTDLKREFERHYTQRDEHFNRLITERMSDLKQTVALLNQERIESKLKLELLENKASKWCSAILDECLIVSC